MVETSYSDNYTQLVNLISKYSKRIEELDVIINAASSNLTKNVKNTKKVSVKSKRSGLNKRQSRVPFNDMDIVDYESKMLEQQNYVLQMQRNHQIDEIQLVDNEDFTPELFYPFSLLSSIRQTVVTGGFLTNYTTSSDESKNTKPSNSLYIPRAMWTQLDLKFSALSTKHAAFDSITNVINQHTAAFQTVAHANTNLHLLSTCQALRFSIKSMIEEFVQVQNNLSKPFPFIREIMKSKNHQSVAVDTQSTSDSAAATNDSLNNANSNSSVLSGNAESTNQLLNAPNTSQIDESAASTATPSVVATTSQVTFKLASMMTSLTKSVKKYAEVGYQRLGTMSVKVTSADFLSYSNSIVKLCESTQVRRFYTVHAV